MAVAGVAIFASNLAQTPLCLQMSPQRQACCASALRHQGSMLPARRQALCACKMSTEPLLVPATRLNITNSSAARSRAHLGGLVLPSQLGLAQHLLRILQQGGHGRWQGLRRQAYGTAPVRCDPLDDLQTSAA